MSFLFCLWLWRQRWSGRKESWWDWRTLLPLINYLEVSSRKRTKKQLLKWFIRKSYCTVWWIFVRDEMLEYFWLLRFYFFLCCCTNQVIVRMRPLNRDEEEGEMIVQKISNDSLSIAGQTFTFDSIADFNSRQARVLTCVCF